MVRTPHLKKLSLHHNCHDAVEKGDPSIMNDIFSCITDACLKKTTQHELILAECYSDAFHLPVADHPFLLHLLI